MVNWQVIISNNLNKSSKNRKVIEKDKHQNKEEQNITEQNLVLTNEEILNITDWICADGEEEFKQLLQHIEKKKDHPCILEFIEILWSICPYDLGKESISKNNNTTTIGKENWEKYSSFLRHCLKITRKNHAPQDIGIWGDDILV